MAMRRIATLVSLLLQAHPGPLTLVVIEGEGAVNIIQQDART